MKVLALRLSVFAATVAWVLSLGSIAGAELVYEEDPQSPAESRTTDREALRQTMDASERVHATQQRSLPTAAPAPVLIQTQPAAPQPQVQVQTLPAYAPPATQVTTVSTVETVPAAPEVQNLSKSELMRRERVRTEIKNEDILQERLEELRLRDERKRTDQLLSPAPVPAAQTEAAPLPAPALREEVVTSPYADQETRDALVRKTTPLPPTAAESDRIAVSQAATMAGEEERTPIYVQGKGGLSSMSSDGAYEVTGRYSAGVALGVVVSDNLSFEAGYTYSEYGVALANSGQGFYPGWGATTPNPTAYETIAMKQNVIDAGLKLHMLGPDARLRPYVGGGAAYGKSFVNYDTRVLSWLNQMGRTDLGRDYETTSFLGYLSAGFDLKVAKSVFVGANFRYHKVLTSRENNTLNPYAFAQPGGFGAFAAPDADKQVVGGSLAASGFYSILAGVTFLF
jgi:hypothetical protein